MSKLELVDSVNGHGLFIALDGINIQYAPKETLQRIVDSYNALLILNDDQIARIAAYNETIKNIKTVKRNASIKKQKEETQIPNS